MKTFVQIVLTSAFAAGIFLAGAPTIAQAKMHKKKSSQQTQAGTGDTKATSKK